MTSGQIGPRARTDCLIMIETVQHACVVRGIGMAQCDVTTMIVHQHMHDTPPGLSVQSWPAPESSHQTSGRDELPWVNRLLLQHRSVLRSALGVRGTRAPPVAGALRGAAGTSVFRPRGRGILKL